MKTININKQKKLSRLIASKYTDYVTQDIDELNKISKELGISDESMTSLMKQFESYKWIIKLNTQVTPTIVDFGKYAIELFTGKKMFNEANQESKKIMFKLRFGMRMESDCKVAKLS